MEYFMCVFFFFFFKQKTAYEMAQCDWSSDVCSSDLDPGDERAVADDVVRFGGLAGDGRGLDRGHDERGPTTREHGEELGRRIDGLGGAPVPGDVEHVRGRCGDERCEAVELERGREPLGLV